MQYIGQGEWFVFCKTYPEFQSQSSARMVFDQSYIVIQSLLASVRYLLGITQNEILGHQ